MEDDLSENHDRLITYITTIFKQIDKNDTPLTGRYLLREAMTEQMLETATHMDIMMEMQTTHLLILEQRARQEENGACCHKASIGDKVIICTYADIDIKEIKNHKPKIIHVDDKNRILDSNNFDNVSLVE